MNKFIVRMLELGAELDKAVSPIEMSMVINDAEILYKEHIKDHQSKVNNVVLDGVSNCEHKFVRTGDSFDLTVYCSKCGKEG
mgnify:CR=1 FL=1|tara:strand:+ start:666 stop:911 length:246 start_codon:yes stop_codon:yes gene_type:complete